MSSKHTVSSKKHHGSPDSHKKGRRSDPERRSKSPRIHHRMANRRSMPARRISPRRSSFSTTKSVPVNELDLLTGDAKPKSGLSLENSTSTVQSQRNRDFGYRGRNNTSGMRFGYSGSGRPGGIGYRQGRDVRCFANFAQRRNATGRDLVGTSKSFERAGRSQQWHAKKEEEDAKPVMNLFDPCKVPTGKSYFTHDDRSVKSSRENGFDRKFSAPLGWRNAPRDHLAKYRTQTRETRNVSSRTSRVDKDGLKPKNNSKSFDEVWKHDLFQEEQSQGEIFE